VSAPARLILLTEQTHAWERGDARGRVRGAIKRYMLGHGGPLPVVILPACCSCSRPELARLLFSAKNVGAVDATRIVIVAGALRMVYGWIEVVPRLDRAAGAANLDARRRAARADPARARARLGVGRKPARTIAVLASSVAFLPLLDVSSSCGSGASRRGRGATFEAALGREVLIVSGIWPPDVGGPASHAPDVARFLAGRGHDIEVVTTAERAPAPEDYPVRWVSRSLPVGVRHVRGLALVRSRARRADVVYTTGMFGRSSAGALAAQRPYVVKLTADPAFERSRRRGLVAGDVDEFQEGGGGPVGFALRRARNFELRRAAYVYCPSAYLRSWC
jgi:hypothetical protein